MYRDIHYKDQTSYDTMFIFVMGISTPGIPKSTRPALIKTQKGLTSY